MKHQQLLVGGRLSALHVLLEFDGRRHTGGNLESRDQWPCRYQWHKIAFCDSLELITGWVTELDV